MREAMAGLVQVMAHSMKDAFTEQEVWRHEIDSYWSDQKKINNLIDGEVRKLPGLNREMRARATAFVKQQWIVKKREIYEDMSREARALAGQFFERMDAESAEVADRALRRVFEDDPGVPARVSSLKDYTFSLFEAKEGEFILGDCAAVGVREDGEARLAFGDFDQAIRLDYIFLPISPTRCVVGSLHAASSTYSVAQINRLSASLSHRFFISRSAQIHELDELKTLIGTAEPMASEADVAVLMKSIGD